MNPNTSRRLRPDYNYYAAQAVKEVQRDLGCHINWGEGHYCKTMKSHVLRHPCSNGPDIYDLKCHKVKSPTQLYVFLHELGHIACQHRTPRSLHVDINAGPKVIKEEEQAWDWATVKLEGFGLWVSGSMEYLRDKALASYSKTYEVLYRVFTETKAHQTLWGERLLESYINDFNGEVL